MSQVFRHIAGVWSARLERVEWKATACDRLPSMVLHIESVSTNEMRSICGLDTCENRRPLDEIEMSDHDCEPNVRHRLNYIVYCEEHATDTMYRWWKNSEGGKRQTRGSRRRQKNWTFSRYMSLQLWCLFRGICLSPLRHLEFLRNFPCFGTFLHLNRIFFRF